MLVSIPLHSWPSALLIDMLLCCKDSQLGMVARGAVRYLGQRTISGGMRLCPAGRCYFFPRSVKAEGLNTACTVSPYLSLFIEPLTTVHSPGPSDVIQFIKHRHSHGLPGRHRLAKIYLFLSCELWTYVRETAQKDIRLWKLPSPKIL